MTLSIFIAFSAQQLHIDLIANDFDIERLISLTINVFIAANFWWRLRFCVRYCCTDYDQFISRRDFNVQFMCQNK